MTFNPMDLSGRSMLVTGASSGLGRATAVLLSRLGARVLLLGRDESRLQESLAMLEGQGHATVAFDLRDTDAIPELVADQAKRFAPFAGLVHSAGLMQTKPLHVCRTEDYESLYRVNVIAGAQLLSGLTKRGAIPREGCSAVMVSSVSGVAGYPAVPAYSSSKAALLGLVRSAATELARVRLRVNAVVPAHIPTPGSRPEAHSLTEEQWRVLEAKHPLGFGRPDDVANAAAFLLADTGRWITGIALVVDGGLIL